MADIYQTSSVFLAQLEAELKVMQLWQQQPPSEQALASEQPFCLDTLTFEQWLQFVFIDKMVRLIEQRQSLPAKFGLAPMCEEGFAGRGIDSRCLAELLERLDEALSAD